MAGQAGEKEALISSTWKEAREEYEGEREGLAGR